MHRSIAVKTVTLFFFFSLVTLFIVYRTGYFYTHLPADATSIQTSSNGGTVKAGDSAFAKKDSSSNLLMSSSKVIILTDSKTDLFSTSSKKKTKAIRKPLSISQLLTDSLGIRPYLHKTKQDSTAKPKSN